MHGIQSIIVEVSFLLFFWIFYWLEIYLKKKIERVQNRGLYQAYLIKKEIIKNKNNGNENEKILYHGSDEQTISKISKSGFNRSYCGKNGEIIIYFSVLTRFIPQMKLNRKSK